MTYAKITATGSYLPEQVLTNEELEAMVETNSEWIMKRVGIKERHVIGDSGDTCVTMATKAALHAIADCDLEPNDIDLIVVATASADNFFPSVACLVQDALGITNECAAFDINAACAGFIYGITMGDQFIRSHQAKNVLVIGVDALSAVVDWTDRSTCVLFGDGAGAVILSADDEPGILTTILKSAGKYGDLLYARSSLWDEEDPGKLRMSGREVYKLAVTKLDEIVDQTLEKAGLDKSEIDWLIPHQANIRIIQSTAKRLNLPMEKVLLTIQEHGNTSAASIPLALDAGVRRGSVRRGQVLMLEAFGAGLAWGSALVKY